MKKITEYHHTDGRRQWELWYEDTIIVILNDDQPLEPNVDLIAFDAQSLKLIWTFEGLIGCSPPDVTTIVYVKNGQLWMCSFFGLCARFDHRTGEIQETEYVK